MNRFRTIALATMICVAAPAAVVHAAAAPKPKTLTPDQLKWVPSTAAPGVMTATAWGDPAKGPHGAFHKFPAGFTAALHTHSANARIVVLSGTMVLAGKDGKEMKFPPGSFYTEPKTFNHVTKCMPESECMVYLQADGKWDLIPDAKP